MLSFERPNYLKNTLKSLKDKPGHPYQLIIHDDGSTDANTTQLIYDQAMQGATTIFNSPGNNQGQGVALNRMFQMSRGDPIIKLDADLHFHPGWLMETVRLMNENPQIGLLGLLHYYHDPVDTHKTIIERHDEWSEHTHILGSAFAVRRECWEELGPFEEGSEAFAEDFIFQQAVTESDNWVCALPKESLVDNLGMGLGKSMVVQDDGNGGMKVHSIRKEPYVFGRD